MKRKNNRDRSLLWVCLTVLLLCFLSGCDEESGPAALTATDRFFVNDFANVLSDEAENAMYEQGVQLYEKTKAQVVAVTVDSLDGEQIEDYSYDLANRWGIGEAEKDTGVLLLLAVEEREVRIEVGSGLEGQLTDGKTGRLLDTYAIPSFKKDDFSTGMKKVYNALVNEVYLEFGQEAEEGYVPADQLPDAQKDDEFDLTLVIGVIIMVGAILLICRFFPLGVAGGHYHGGGFGGGGFSGGGGGFSGGGGGFSGGGSSRGF